MTKNQKQLNNLLTVAIQYGYEVEEGTNINVLVKNLISNPALLEYTVSYFDRTKVSFLGALAKATEEKLSYDDYLYWIYTLEREYLLGNLEDELLFLWHFKVDTTLVEEDSDRRPSNQKLEWLLNTFKHLLQ